MGVVGVDDGGENSLISGEEELCNRKQPMTANNEAARVAANPLGGLRDRNNQISAGLLGPAAPVGSGPDANFRRGRLDCRFRSGRP